MVGGKIVQVYHDFEKLQTWINVEDNGDYCAIKVEGVGFPNFNFGDKLWWQAGKVYLTNSKGEFEFKRLGGSGINHPLGREYQIVFNHSEIASQCKKKILQFIDLTKELLKSTPTDKDGNFCPINQSQVFKFNEFLLTLNKKYPSSRMYCICGEEGVDDGLLCVANVHKTSDSDDSNENLP